MTGAPQASDRCRPQGSDHSLGPAGDHQAGDDGLDPEADRIDARVAQLEAEPVPLAVPRRDTWRRRTATGAVLTGMALGFQQALERPREEPSIMIETSGDPPSDLPVEAEVGQIRPADNVVMIRPWLLTDQQPATDEPPTDGPPTDGPPTDEPPTDRPGHDQPGHDQPGRRRHGSAGTGWL
ncbi:MAG: hypothetical protein ACRDY0_08730 [Acidimicrobiales bacterium]